MAPFVPPAAHTAGGVAVKVTGKPVDDVAFTNTKPLPSATSGSGRNVIVCGAFVTVKLRGTGVAAAHVVSSPDWLAVTVQTPGPVGEMIWWLTPRLVAHARRVEHDG